MVKKLAQKEQDLIDDALRQAEARTSAVIKTVIVPASETYHAYILIYALALGSIVASGLWACDIIWDFPFLLAIQLGIVALCDLAHSVGGLFIPLIPCRVRHKAGGRAALHAYHALHAHMAKETGFVLLFVSLAERYVHVVTSPVVHRHIPGNWHKVTGSFSQVMRSEGLGKGCAAAIGQIADILAPLFPKA